MFRKISYIPFITELLRDKIAEYHADSVIWLGAYPYFKLYHYILNELGITDIRVMDNSLEKQGDATDGVTIGPVEIDKVKAKNTLFLMHNTHFAEFTKQLEEYGIEKGRILNFRAIISEWRRKTEKEELSDCVHLDLREIQMTELAILKMFKRFCEANGLRYYLAEGTLIGAVRHKGFIPWDDDIDVFMPFEDYLKLIKTFPDSDKYELHDWRKQDFYPFQYVKIFDKETRMIHNGTTGTFGFLSMCICIDVFPMAGYPSDFTKIQEKWRRNKELDNIRTEWSRFQEIESCRGEDRRQQITDEKYGLSFYESSMVGTMQTLNFDPWVVRKEAFAEVTHLLFEDEEFAVPAGYDEYLRVRYGDYMKLPKPEDRWIHHYPSYRINK